MKLALILATATALGAGSIAFAVPHNAQDGQSDGQAAQERENAAQDQENMVQEAENTAQARENMAQNRENMTQGRENMAQNRENMEQHRENMAEHHENMQQHHEGISKDDMAFEMMFDSRLEQAFAAIDSDDNDSISSAEWGAWQADDGFFAERFDDFDRDDDGMISWQEYRGTVRAMYDISSFSD